MVYNVTYSSDLQVQLLLNQAFNVYYALKRHITYQFGPIIKKPTHYAGPINKSQIPASMNLHEKYHERQIKFLIQCSWKQD